MNKFGKELIKSMTEACEHAEGKRGRVRVRTVEIPAGRGSELGLDTPRQERR